MTSLILQPLRDLSLSEGGTKSERAVKRSGAAFDSGVSQKM